MSAFSVFFTPSPLFLDYQTRMPKAHGKNNAQSIFGVPQIPSANQIRNRLDPVSPETVFPLLREIDDGQSESHLRTTLLYTNMTAKAVYEALLQKGWSSKALPTLRTISNLLERHGYRLRRVSKTQVQKKIAETIFENVKKINAFADLTPKTVRLSMDTKATINIGEYSRNGKSRGKKPVKAQDHDMPPKEKLVLGGILEPVSGKAFLFFTDSYKTSDFMVDGLFKWWNHRYQELSKVKRVVLNLDNGPECSGRRTQFLLRMTEFVEVTGLTVHLVYYPPYHSKYNAIERYWAGIEKSWNGYLLKTVDIVLKRATHFVWKGFNALVTFLKNSYETGIKVFGTAKTQMEERLQRSEPLPLYDILIRPKTVQ